MPLVRERERERGGGETPFPQSLGFSLSHCPWYTHGEGENGREGGRDANRGTVMTSPSQFPLSASLSRTSLQLALVRERRETKGGREERHPSRDGDDVTLVSLSKLPSLSQSTAYNHERERTERGREIHK